jgi:hypothetical protein
MYFNPFTVKLKQNYFLNYGASHKNSEEKYVFSLFSIIRHSIHEFNRMLQLLNIWT